MKYLNFQNGDTMPAIGLGTWKSAKGEVYEVVRKAINIGYRHFDCAFLYGNEQEIGNAFADALKAGDVRREELFVTSKLWNNRHRKAQVQPAFEGSLKALQIDYLDLYLIHWPIVVIDEKLFPEKAEELVSLTQTPLTETWESMIPIKESGLAKHIGVSNFNPPKIQAIWDATGVKPEVNQVEMHPFLQQKAMKEYTDKHGILLTAYSPLGSQDRPANRKVDSDPILLESPELNRIAASKSITVAQLILAWAVHYGISAIPKSVNEIRLKENLGAADIKLSDVEMYQISNLDLKNRYIKGDFWCIKGSDYILEELWFG